VIHHPRADQGSLHVAYAIGRPVGTAVTRNRVRRRLRAALVELDREGRVPAPGDLLVAARPRAAEAGYQELRDHLDSSFRALGEVGRP
jgi:ribonuclease P protein component